MAYNAVRYRPGPETGMEWSQVNSKQKLWASAIGGSAIAAMGILGVALAPEPTSPTIVSDPTTATSMTTGETSTEASVAPPAPETGLATPEITTTPTSAEPG